jgi:hypothetical protein
MRKFFVMLVAAFALVCFAGSVVRGQDFKAQKQVLKARHKQEQKALKLKQKQLKAAMKSQALPKSTRAQMIHKMEREKRDLRERHKDEMQDLKDRERMTKEAQRYYPY